MNYIQAFGLFGPLAAFTMSFIQAIAPLVPFMVLAGATGILFGPLLGFIISWGGAVCGACSLYWISRITGKDIFEKRIKPKYKFDPSKFNPRSLFVLLFLYRIFPVIPTPVVNIGSGLGGISFRIFASATALGLLPEAIAFTSLGDYLVTHGNILHFFYMLAAVFVIIAIGCYYFKSWLASHLS